MQMHKTNNILTCTWWLEFSSSCRMMEEVDTLAPCSSATRLITSAQLLATPATNNTAPVSLCGQVAK